MANSYQESLDYLYSLQFFGIKLGLDNIRTLLDRVGQPQRQLRIIHVAGTNGKGSTSAALAGMLHAAGIRTGLYTSPHLHNFTERIRVAGHQIGEAEAVSLVDELRPHAEELKATFFEVTTAMALLSFARHKVAWAVLETGMGGRLDATNVVSPELCVVTPIAMDHAGYLGKSLAAIAAEKAGIFKPGVPVVCARQPEEVTGVLARKGTELGCPLYFLGREYQVEAGEDQCFSVTTDGASLGPFTVSLAGRHQLQNLALAVAGIAVLNRQGLSVSPASMAAGLRRLRWPGRLEWLPERILLDGAHNRAGVDALCEYLDLQHLAGVHLVFGCKADKQAADMLSRLLPFTARAYLTSPPDVDAVNPEELAQVAGENGTAATVYRDPSAALAAARQERHEGEVILIAGSLFLVAALRALLVEEVGTLEIIS